MVDESVTDPAEPVEPTFEEQLAAARAFAMRSLARRESAESELARRLRQQGFKEEVIDAVLDGGVNDALNLDSHGKALSYLLLDLPVQVPLALAERLRSQD
jgi:hypothetical protein